MEKILKIAVLVCVMSFVSGEDRAFAQWDLRGCSQNGVSAAYPQSIESSLWTFRSNVWDGYIDFHEGGKYWTQWGLGTWTVTPDYKGIHMANDFNDKTYEVAFTDNGFRFQGIRNDGLIISGMLLCGKYAGPGPQVPDDVAKSITGFYKGYLGRDAQPEELTAQYRRFLQGVSVEDIRKEILQTEEYKNKVAKDAAKIKELQDSGQLQW